MSWPTKFNGHYRTVSEFYSTVTKENMRVYNAREVALCVENMQRGSVKRQEDSLFSYATYSQAKHLLSIPRA